jgi:hypothetical protein
LQFLFLDDEHKEQHACASRQGIIVKCISPMNDRMGIQITGDIPIARFNMLINREIKSTKWALSHYHQPTWYN